MWGEGRGEGATPPFNVTRTFCVKLVEFDQNSLQLGGNLIPFNRIWVDGWMRLFVRPGSGAFSGTLCWRSQNFRVVARFCELTKQGVQSIWGTGSVLTAAAAAPVSCLRDFIPSHTLSTRTLSEAEGAGKHGSENVSIDRYDNTHAARSLRCKDQKQRGERAKNKGTH